MLVQCLHASSTFDPACPQLSPLAHACPPSLPVPVGTNFLLPRLWIPLGLCLYLLRLGEDEA